MRNRLLLNRFTSKSRPRSRGVRILLEKVADSARKAVKLAEPYKPYGGQFLEFCSISLSTYQTCMKLTRKSTEFCHFFCRHYPHTMYAYLGVFGGKGPTAGRKLCPVEHGRTYRWYCYNLFFFVRCCSEPCSLEAELRCENLFSLCLRSF